MGWTRLRRSFLALHHRGIDRAANLFDRLRSYQELISDHEARRQSRTSGLSTVVVSLDPGLHFSGLNALAPAGDVDALGAGKRVKETCRRRQCFPFGLGVEERVVHLPEFPLGSATHRGLRGVR